MIARLLRKRATDEICGQEEPPKWIVSNAIWMLDGPSKGVVDGSQFHRVLLAALTADVSHHEVIQTAICVPTEIVKNDELFELEAERRDEIWRPEETSIIFFVENLLLIPLLVRGRRLILSTATFETMPTQEKVLDSHSTLSKPGFILLP